MAKNAERPSLTSRQSKYLRGLGHHLQPSVLVGREGLTDALIASCHQGLQAHELIKVKLGQNCPLPKGAAAEQLATRTGAQLVQLLGKTLLLYRPNPDLEPARAIQLPG